MTLTPFNIYNFTDKLTIPSQYSLRSKAFTNKKQKDRDIRALSSKLSKILAFQKITLSILTTHFTMHPTSKVLFLPSSH